MREYVEAHGVEARQGRIFEAGKNLATSTAEPTTKSIGYKE
jgi:hypothetical protein